VYPRARGRRHGGGGRGAGPPLPTNRSRPAQPTQPTQAVITGTFSIIRQAQSLGVFPRLRVVHTGKLVEGQIFIPVVRYTYIYIYVY
jgi:hypothetical protein